MARSSWSPRMKSADRRAATERALAMFRAATRHHQEEWLDARDALIASREYYRQLYDEAAVGLALCDPNGVFLDVNTTGTLLLGRRREAIVGRPLLIFVDRADVDALLQHLARCRARVPVTTSELRLRHERGTHHSIEVTSRLMHAAYGPVYHTTLIDLASRRERELAVRESEQRYREIVEHADEGVCLIDRNQCISYLNARFARLMQADSRALIGRELPSLLHPDDRERGRRLCADSPGRRPPTELRVRRADGTTVWVLVTTTPMRETDGNVHRVLGLFTDISERKAQEAERERLAARLVEAQEAERRRIARELHDQIGQHLVGFSLGLRQLREETGRGDAVERLQAIADGIAKDVHRLALELRPTALDDLGLQDALMHFAQSVGQRAQLDVDVHCAPDCRLSPTAETVIYRIAQEALMNIVKHARARRVGLVLERLQEVVQLIIEDDGVGFDADRLLTFGPLSRRLGITGMVERAALIDGELQIESKPGRGTTLYLRVKRPAPTSGTAAPTTAAGP